MVRGFIGVAITLVAAWTWYMASPFLALRDLAVAVDTRDVPRLATRVNAHALRLSLSKQLAAHGFESVGHGPALGGSDRQLAAAAIATAADPLLQPVFAPRGILRLLRGSPPGSGTDDGEAGEGSVRPVAQPRSLVDLLGASRWRGFRNVYFGLPVGAPADERFRLQFRLSRLRWRLVGIDLPPRLRHRIIDEVLRRADLPR